MKKERIIFAVILLIFFFIAVFYALQYDPVAGRAPLIVAVPCLLLAVYALIAEIKQKDPGQDTTEKKAEENQESELPASEIKRRERTIIVWIILIAVSIYIIGFILAIPLYLLVMLRFWGKERWLLSIVLSAATAAVIYFFFVSLMHVNLYEGFLLRTFG